jgi:hypothetical protein
LLPRAAQPKAGLVERELKCVYQEAFHNLALRDFIASREARGQGSASDSRTSAPCRHQAGGDPGVDELEGDDQLGSRSRSRQMDGAEEETGAQQRQIRTQMVPAQGFEP